MLSGEANAREWWKTTIGLISKKKSNFSRWSTLFLYISLPLFCTNIAWNFQKLLSNTFFGGNVVRVLVHFFFTAVHFHLALVADSISHFVTAATKFSCCSSNKKMSPLFFISRSRPPAPSPFFSLCFAGLPPTFSFSLSFSCSIFQICGHDNLILTTQIQKQFPPSVFVFIDSLVVSALQDAGGYAISGQNNLELHLGCHTCWLSYFTFVCLWCGRMVGRLVGRSVYGHVIT